LRNLETCKRRVIEVSAGASGKASLESSWDQGGGGLAEEVRACAASAMSRVCLGMFESRLRRMQKSKGKGFLNLPVLDPGWKKNPRMSVEKSAAGKRASKKRLAKRR